MCRNIGAGNDNGSVNLSIIIGRLTFDEASLIFGILEICESDEWCSRLLVVSSDAGVNDSDALRACGDGARHNRASD